MDIQDNVTPELARIVGELQKLQGISIHVGIQGAAGYGVSQEGKAGAPADLLTIANVHEFGATISAKTVKNLAIPLVKKAMGKSPRDFAGLFFLESDGRLYGCISKNRKGSRRQSGKPSDTKPKTHKPGNGNVKSGKQGDIEFLFILMPSVNIPERSFIRAGYESGRGQLEEAAQTAISGIVMSGWDAETAAHHIGMTAVGIIQMYMNTPSNFKAKGSITKTTSNWPGNPLVESGRLRNSISYTIEGV
ncbi:MAG: hypothetical protein ACRDBO_10850 [Lachnospiraceae bacterium]